MFSLSKSITIAWLGVSELALLLFGIMLVGGLVGEYFADHKKKEYPWCKQFKHWFEILVIVGVAGELFGDGGIFLFSSHLQTISNIEVSMLNGEAEQARKDAAASNERAANAEKEAGLANERAARIESTNAQLSLQIEGLRSNNLTLEASVIALKLQMEETAKTANEARDFVNESNTIQRINEEHAELAKASKVVSDIGSIVTNSNLGAVQNELSEIKPRSFTDGQIQTGIAVLGLYRGTPVEINSALGDSEATHFSDQLTDLLTSNGWKVSGRRRVVWGHAPGAAEMQGIRVTLRRDKDFPAATALIHFLKSCDIQVQGFRPPTLGDSDIVVDVCPK